MAQTPKKSFRWLDLSGYGMTLLAQGLPAGGKLLVIDGGKPYAEKLSGLGFVFHEKSGYFVHAGNVAPTFKDIVSVFPEGRVISDEDTLASGQKVSPSLFWRPAATKAAPTDVPPAEPKADFLGINKLGHRVYKSTQGRFMAPVNSAHVYEADKASMPPGLFLRATDATQLSSIADGLVLSLKNSNTIRFSDFLHVAEAAYDEKLEPTDPRLQAFHAALQGSVARLIIQEGGKTSADIYRTAERFHAAQPYLGELSRHQGHSAQPLAQPISVLIQRLLGNKADVNGKRVVVSGPGVMFGQIGTGADLKVFDTDPDRIIQIRQCLATAKQQESAAAVGAPDYSDADMVVANLRPGYLDALETISGVKVGRADYAELLKSLEARKEDGRSIFVFNEPSSEEDSEEAARVRDYVGRHYFVEGEVSLTGSLNTGRPESPNLRLYVVGPRRFEVLDSLPDEEVKTISDYTSLWTWGTSDYLKSRNRVAEEAASEKNAEDIESDDFRSKNTFQTPYTSMSKTSEASTMVPRNLEGPLREAFARIAKHYGDVDALVANETGYSLSQLGEVLSPEQIDAVAMHIDAERRGRALLIADDTGIGKGRSMAAMARRWILRAAENPNGHRKVLFLTERAINLSDFWRDITHIQSGDDFAPFLINSDVNVIDEKTGQTVMASEHRLLFKTLSHLNHWPDGQEVVCRVLNEAGVAHYGSPELFAFGGREEDVPESMVKQTLRWSPFSNLMLATYSQFNKSAEDKEKGKEEDGTYTFTPGNKKAKWIQAVVDADTLVVVDECHNITSETSNVAANMAMAIAQAGNVVFSSATFAKVAQALQMFGPLFPEDFDCENLGEVVRKGGETLQETLSAMLVKDGVMIRREHDLSKSEFVMEEDTTRKAVHRRYQDLVSPVLAEMAYLSGDLQGSILVAQDALLRVGEERLGGQIARRGRMQVSQVGIGSPLYRISRIFLCSLLCDFTIDTAVKDLRENRKPVILVENTVQALLEELATEQGDDTILEQPDFKDLIRRTLTQLTVVRTRQADGSYITENLAPDRPDLDLAEELVISVIDDLPASILKPNLETVDNETFHLEAKRKLKESVEARIAAIPKNDHRRAHAEVAEAIIDEALGNLPNDAARLVALLPKLTSMIPSNPGKSVRRIEAMIDLLPNLPVSSIDYVKKGINDAGFSCGEITGRSLEYIDGRITRRAVADKTVIKNAFNSGETDAVIINVSGATGIDLHAGRRFANQLKRTLIVQQAPADITKQIQAYGRVNRFDQVQGPLIRLLMAGLPIEMRLLAMLNSKLRRMSANITSNRDHSSLIRNIPDLINAVGDQVCTRYAEARPDLMRRLGFSIGEHATMEATNATEDARGRAESTQDSKRSANTFLARLCMLPVAMQEQVIAEVEAEFRMTLEDLEAKGENPLKTRTISGRVIDSKQAPVVFQGVERDHYESEFSKPVYAQEIEIHRDVEPIRGNKLIEMCERGMIDLAGVDLEDVAATLLRRKEYILATFMPRNAASIEDAIAQGDPTILHMNDRLVKLAEILTAMRPGSQVEVLHDQAMETAIVTKVLLPRRGYEHLPSNWEVEVVMEGDWAPRRLTLGSLMSQEEFSIKEGLNGEDADKYIEQFDRSVDATRVERRIMLIGNDWAAMNLSIKHKLGTMTSYVDQEGVTRRGVLVSKKHKNLDFVPIPVTNQRLILEALRSGQVEEIRESSGNMQNGRYVAIKTRPDGSYFLHFPALNSKAHSTFFSNEHVRGMYDEANPPSAKRRKPLLVQPEDIERTLNIIHAAGLTFQLPPSMREWVNDWNKYQAQNEKRDADTQVVPSIAA